MSVLKCSYRGCKREAVSGGNLVVDTEGEIYDVDLCEFHLNKLINNGEEHGKRD